MEFMTVGLWASGSTNAVTIQGGLEFTKKGSIRKGTEITIPLRGINFEAVAQQYPDVRFITVGSLDEELGIDNLDFLVHFPLITSLHIKSLEIRNIDALATLRHLEGLNIEWHASKMHVLGQLKQLNSIYVGMWRGGSNSIFELENLISFTAQSFPHPTLEVAHKWQRLESLRINGGKLNNLAGIPSTVKIVDLSTMRYFSSIHQLNHCPNLEELFLETCRKFTSLEGIEECRKMRRLVISQIGELYSLRPLAKLENLEYCYVWDSGKQPIDSIEVLYSLPKLTTLHIRRWSGIDPTQLANAGSMLKFGEVR